MAAGKSHKCRCASELINRGLVTPYAEMDIGQILFIKWLIAWRHQVITRFDIDEARWVIAAAVDTLLNITY